MQILLDTVSDGLCNGMNSKDDLKRWEASWRSLPRIGRLPPRTVGQRMKGSRKVDRREGKDFSLHIPP
jgi:hypothetical protein